MGLITTAEAAQQLNVTQAAILKFIKEGRLPAHQALWNTRKVWRINTDDLKLVHIYNKGLPKGIAPPNPSGICQCGCGQPAPIAAHTNIKKAIYKGHHCRYIKGHNDQSLSPTEYAVDPDTGCWVWQRDIDAGGYGRMYANGKSGRRAHRVFYERKYGPIPETHDIDHLCRNRACVNPDHLEPVITAANVRRGNSPKITKAIADEIRQLRETEHTPYQKLGIRFGISGVMARNICIGRWWRDYD